MTVSSSLFYAAITFLAGVGFLAAWLYATAENARSTRILVKSVVLFVVPGVALASVPPRFLHSEMAVFAAILAEEVLKAVASLTENNEYDRFWLICLFGIWELTLAKPVWGITHYNIIENLDKLQLVGLTLGGCVTVLMHSVTAKIYCSRLLRKIGLALIVAWAFHATFDEAVRLFVVSFRELSIVAIVLVAIFIAMPPQVMRLESH